MNEEKHTIESVEKYEEMIGIQKKLAIFNASVCALFSGFCIYDACLFLNTQNPLFLIFTVIQGILGFRHFFYTRCGQDLIYDYKEKVRELKQNK